MKRSSRRVQQPNWPVWVHSKFTPTGMDWLERSYWRLKDSDDFSRATRISAEDHASSVAALLQSQGRADLVI